MTSEFRSGLHYDQFIELVADMRAKQKAYFAERNRSNLIDAKVAEGLVDKMIQGFALAAAPTLDAANHPLLNKLPGTTLPAAPLPAAPENGGEHRTPSRHGKLENLR